MRFLSMHCMFIVFLISFCTASFAQSAATAPTTLSKAKISAKGLVFDKIKVDFGKLNSNAGVRYATYTGTNKTKEIIRIVSIDKSCGCMARKIEKKVIKPGESTSIQMMLDPYNKSNGRTTQSLTIKTDEKLSMPYYKLEITADIKAVRMSGFRANNLIRGQKIWISSQVDAVSPSLATAVIDLSTSLIKIHRTKIKGNALFLEVSTTPNTPRLVSANVYVRDPTSKNVLISVPLFINVKDNYEFNTPSLFLGSMNAGNKVEKTVSIKANIGKVPPIKEITFDKSKPEQVTAEIISKPNASPIIRLTLHPDKMDAKIFRDIMKVKFNDKNQPEANLILFGRVKKEAKVLKHGG
jgi:Protein of unknown function (DUF1573)